MRSSPKLSRTAIAAAPEKHSARTLSKSKQGRTKGHAVIEAALLLPCLVSLFVGAFDMGFYCYALIGVENATRNAVEYPPTSTYTARETGAAFAFELQQT